jgi:putative transposase
LNPSKCNEYDYINFLIASTKIFTCTEAARCQLIDENSPSHDAFTRLLQRQPPDTGALWKEVQPFVEKEKGFLILDDSTLDKPYSRELTLVYRHWSGKQQKVVNGINLISLVWTDGNATIPIDFRIYDIDQDEKTKNDHFKEMLTVARSRGFKPEFVMFDSWYGSIGNLKLLRDLHWHWLTRLKKNRLVNPDWTYNRQIHEIEIPPSGKIVHLKEYGTIKVFCIIPPDNEREFWATDVLDLEESTRSELAARSNKIEQYHRGIKQFCGIERCQARNAQSQKAHILLAIRAFLRLEITRIITGNSWFELKYSIIRNAIRAFLISPKYCLPSTDNSNQGFF